MGNTFKAIDELYNLGDIVEFRLKNIFGNYVEVIDDRTEICTYIRHTDKLMLVKNQILQCRIIGLTEKRPLVELVSMGDTIIADNKMDEKKLSSILAENSLTHLPKDFHGLVFDNERGKVFEKHCKKWLRTLRDKKMSCELVKDECITLLENTNFLDICDASEREFYQERLTFIIELLHQFARASEMISHSDADEDVSFIKNLISKLSCSGYLFHPIENCRLLSFLFDLKPSLVNDNIDGFLSALSARSSSNWRKDPFRTAFSDLLEMYVDKSIHSLMKDKKVISSDNNILRALAMQLFLLKDATDDSPEYRISESRMCISLSFTSTNDDVRKQLIDRAFTFLFQPSSRMPEFKEINLLPHLISNMAPVSDSERAFQYSFSKGKVLMRISNNSIQIYENGDIKKSTCKSLPDSLNMWNNLQVLFSERLPCYNELQTNPDINQYKKLWDEIELYLFRAQPSQPKPQTASNRKHRVGDSVIISITGQDSHNRNKFLCQIEKEDINAPGYILMEDIVPYNVGDISFNCFLTNDGSRYLFNAQIKETDGDAYRFSMIDEIKDFAQDYYNEYDEIICSLGKEPTTNWFAPAISQDGISVSLIHIDNYEYRDELKVFDIVRCRQIGSQKTGTFHIIGEIVDKVENADSRFSMSEAFKNLLDSYSCGSIPDYSELEEDESQNESVDKIIDESHIKEIINMLDRLARIDKEYIKSFNYLGFARILCLMIGDSLSSYYKSRMDIILLLLYFQKNFAVDNLEKFHDENAELFCSDSILDERFKQLKILSYLGKVGKEEELFHLPNGDDKLIHLASLVFSYNTAVFNKLNSAASEIQNCIFKTLNLKGYEPDMKKYGIGEDVNTEYKSSAIFPPNESAPNPSKQIINILREICAFANTDGGTLYLGVNDDGYGVGLKDDLDYNEFSGDKDRLIRFIIDAIGEQWDNAFLTTCLNVRYDSDNDRDVIIIDVKPSGKELSLGDGEYYTRVASECRKLSLSELRDFKKSRFNEPINLVSKQTEPHSVVEIVKDGNLTSIYSGENHIQTSKRRKNIIEPYNDEYIEPISFFKFVSGGKFKRLVDYDYDTNSSLTLAILEEEKDGYLILGYENGNIVKIPIDELLEFKENQEYTRYNDCNLIFASVAKKNELILTISVDKVGKTKFRVDSECEFEDGKLNDKGECKINDDLIKSIVAFDVLPETDRKVFTNVLDKQGTFIGSEPNWSAEPMIKKLNEYGITSIDVSH